MRHHWIKRAAGAAILAAAALAAGASAASAEGVYFRVGGGYDWALPSAFADRDCATTPPPYALYGCGTGTNGLPYGAYGGFGGSPAFEVAAGFRAAPAIRLEAALSFRPGFAFAGESNFHGTPGDQPVTASLDQAALMGWAYVDLGTGAGWPVTPFIGIGAGVSRNVLSPVHFEFPGLKQPSWSDTPGGTRWSPAFGLALGASRQLTDNLSVELTYRLVSYGRVATDVGDLVSRRGGPVFLIPIDETWTRLTTNAVMLSLRWGLGD